MKTLIPIFLFILLMTSCEKKYCWECTTFVEDDYVFNSDWSTFTSDEKVVCDKSEDGIEAYEKERTYSTMYNINTGTQHLVESTCICLKQ